jgi:hypothetical protein
MPWYQIPIQGNACMTRTCGPDGHAPVQDVFARPFGRGSEGLRVHVDDGGEAGAAHRDGGC